MSAIRWLGVVGLVVVAACGGGERAREDSSPGTTGPTSPSSTSLAPGPPTTTTGRPTPRTYAAPVDLGAGWAGDINSHGAIVGAAGELNAGHAVWWPAPPAPAARLEGDLPAWARAVRINDAGTILVNGEDGTGLVVLVVDPASGTSVELSLPFPYVGPGPEATGINDRGQVVGSVVVDYPEPVGEEEPNPIRHAFWWDSVSGEVVELPTLEGAGSSCSATAISDAGLIVGSCDDRPVAWDSLRSIRVLDLGGAPFGGASAVNEAGQIVGHRQTSGAAPKAVRWLGPTAAVEDLERLAPGPGLDIATDVNEAGEIVGMSGSTLWIWDHTSRTAEELPLSTGSWSGASVNDAGQVVGSVAGRVLLWTPQ